MKHNKNVYTLLLLLLFTKSQREKKMEKTFLASAGAQKRWILGIIFHNVYRIPKINSQ